MEIRSKKYLALCWDSIKRNLFAKPVTATINKFIKNQPAINRLIAHSFKLPEKALVFDHLEFHTTSKTAHAATVEKLKQAGYKFLMTFTGEGIPRSVFAIPDTKFSVAICEPDPEADYSGRPEVFLEHIGFVLKDNNSFGHLFATATKSFTKAANDTTISKCVHSTFMISATVEIKGSSPLFKLIKGLNSIEFLDKNPAEVLKPKVS
jgi:hypothetical protein